MHKNLGNTSIVGGHRMRTGLRELAVKLQRLATWADGQDLVEYSLIISLFSIAAVVSSQKIALAITTIFTNVSTNLA
jgi:Flp pilus assembly pilin Flp